MPYWAEGLALIQQIPNSTSTFVWYSNVAQSVMDLRIVGSYQEKYSNSLLPREYGMAEEDSMHMFYAANIVDGTGFILQTGDDLYEQAVGYVYLGPNFNRRAQLQPHLVRGSVVIKNEAETTTYAENEDYKVDYTSGVISMIDPTDGIGSIVSTLDPGWYWHQCTFDDTKYSAGTGMLILENTGLGYPATGSWYSYSFTRSKHLGWRNITFNYTAPVGTTITASLYSGDASNVDVAAGTGALPFVSIDSGTDLEIDLTDDTYTDFSAYVSLRIKLVFTSTDLTQTPTVTFTGTGAMVVNLLGGKCSVAYNFNKNHVVATRNIADDMNEVTLQRTSR